MTVRRIKMGKGFSEREVPIIARDMSGQDVIDTLQHVASGRSFDGKVRAVEEFADEVLAEAKCDAAEWLPVEDSKEDYARQLSNLIRIVRRYVAEQNADSAARFAVEIGWLACECADKFGWEKHALIGVRTIEANKERGAEANDQRHKARVEQAAKEQQCANEAWKRQTSTGRRPISKNAMARHLKESGKAKGKIATIARRLKAPSLRRK